MDANGKWDGRWLCWRQRPGSQTRSARTDVRGYGDRRAITGAVSHIVPHLSHATMLTLNRQDAKARAGRRARRMLNPSPLSSPLPKGRGMNFLGILPRAAIPLVACPGLPICRPDGAGSHRNERGRSYNVDTFKRYSDGAAENSRFHPRW